MTEEEAAAFIEEEKAKIESTNKSIAETDWKLLELSARLLEQGAIVAEREERLKEVEESRRRAIAEAEKAGTVVSLCRWDEPYQYKENIVAKLCREMDLYRAMAILDGALERQYGKYVFFFDGRVGRNSTDTEELKRLISIEVKKMLSDGKEVEQINHYLETWTQQPQQPARQQLQQPCNGLMLPPELDTPRARKAIEKAIAGGLIDRAPNGLKWRGIMGVRGKVMQWACFCKLAWKPDGTCNLPETTVNNLFGGKHISKYVHEYEARYHNRTPKWGEQIEALFKE